MRRCIIHFGLHKTGTSSVQEALFSSNLGPDKTYLHFETPYIGRKLTTAFCCRPSRFFADLRNVSESDSESTKMELQQLIESAPERCIIISAEDISLFQEEELVDFINFLRKNGLTLEAVAYVRDYRSWCESFFQQSAKYGHWGTSLFPLGANAYRFAIEKFDRLLGRENVTLWKYDRSQFPDGCVVKDFFRRLQIGEFSGEAEEVNSGLCIEAVKFMRILHANGLRPLSNTPDLIARYWLSNHMRSMRGNRVRFHSKLISERMKLVASDLDWIEQRLGESVRNDLGDESDVEAIRSEADLETFSAESLEWLSRESGLALHTDGGPQNLVLDVARAMAALQDKISSNPQFKKAPHMSRKVVSRVIWTFWSQGRDNAPPLVQRCFESWQEMNPNWSLRVLDESEASTYLSSATIPLHRLEAMRITNKSELLRLRLLFEHGGIWTDATNFCLQPLDRWVLECMDGGFFAFRDAAPFVMVSTWFLAASRSSRLAELWRDELERFWAAADYLQHGSYPGQKAMELPLFQRGLLQLFHKLFDHNTRSTDLWFHPLVRLVFRSYPYCVMLYLFSRGYRHNTEWHDLASKMAYRPAKPILAPYSLVEEGKSFDQIVQLGQKQNLPMLKFNWKRPPYDFEQATKA
jgi:hypothetical protein